MKKEKFQGFYYVDRDDRPVNMSTRVRWLEEIEISGLLYKTRLRKAFAYFYRKYPGLENYIKLF